MGRSKQEDAEDDREIELLLAMTDQEVLAEVGEDEIGRAKQSLEAVKRRLGF